MPPGRLVAVEGASAAGKSTVLEAVARETGWPVVPEAYRRLAPTPSLRFRSSAELVDLERRLLEEDGRRYSEARDRARSGIPVLADTGFLGPLTYAWALIAIRAAPAKVLPPLVELARTLRDRGEWGLADAYVYVDTPASVRSARTRADPAGHPADLAPRHAEVGAIERRFYRERFAPLLGPRFGWVAGEGPVSLVAERLADAARASLHSTHGLPPVDAILALFEVGDVAGHPSRGNR